MKGKPTPGYIAFEPIKSYAEVALGLKDITKEGLDPNGVVVQKGDLSEWPHHDAMIIEGKRILVPRHALQVFKVEDHENAIAIIHCTDIKYVF